MAIEGLSGILVPVAVMREKTLRESLSFEGIGVHSGRRITMTLRPREEGGVVFRRIDLGGVEIEAGSARIEAGHCSALISEGGKVLTVEHLTAALFMLGVDSVLVEMNGPEVPILDGSALPYVQGLNKTGLRELESERKSLVLRRPFRLAEGGASLEAEPDEKLRVTYAIAFDHPAVGTQELSLELDGDVFCAEVAPARTFGFKKDAPSLKRMGLALGASWDNTVVLDEKGIVNGPLRFPDEFVRHKILDFLGDLALFGHPLCGRFFIKRGGHDLHHRLVGHLRTHPELLHPAG